ncbi:MAG: dTMP kinase [Bacillota bacterium]|nr:dTMP kinase [Bacillota bacterium]
MKYQAVIFDLDGTLTESSLGVLNGIRYAFDKLKLEHPDEATLRRYLGPPLHQSLMEFSGFTPEQATLGQDYYREYYDVTGAYENMVFPGIRLLLHTLKNLGVYLSVATHKTMQTSIEVLKAFDLYRYFDTVQGPLIEEDPEPDKAELIRRANPGGLKAVMIGDRASDASAAHQNGHDSIAALYGYGHKEEFEKVGTTMFAECADDIYALLGIEKPKPKGFFISFEGNDGSGKSTQAKLLAEHLRQTGHDVLLTREPGGTRVGERIREILLDRDNNDMEDLTEAMLYAAARAQHVRQVILPALEAGKTVVSDRFVDSSIAYQGAGRGLGIDLVRQINAPAVENCLPDLTVFLKLDPEVGMKRFSGSREADRLELAGEEFHQAVAEAFEKIITTEERFVTVSSKGSKADTAKTVYEQVLARLNERDLP